MRKRKQEKPSETMHYPFFSEAAKWIGKSQTTCHSDQGSLEVGEPCPYFRKIVRLGEGIKRAVLYATARGVYNLYINGKKVGWDIFSPGWSNYDQLLYVQRYNVTGLVREGINGLGVVLGDGWYAGNLAHVGRFHYGTYPLSFVYELKVIYEDGRTESVVSNEQWMFAEGEIQYSDMLMGEYVDRRKSLGNFSVSTYISDYRWKMAAVLDSPQAKLHSQDFEGVQCNRVLCPVSATQLDNGKVIYDLGQNMVGYAAVELEGISGGSAILRFGEMLNDDGTLYTANLRTAKATDVFVCAGGDRELFRPLFTFHGFRYVEVTLDRCRLISLKGEVLFSAIGKEGHLACDVPLVNQIYSNIKWGQRGNFLSLPTDCPQRNERMGWTADAQVFCRTAMYNYDCRSFYRKYLRDVRLAANAEGAVCDVAPAVRGMGYGTPAWADACVVLPYEYYLFYKDPSVIRKNYACMENWISYMLAHCDENFVRDNPGLGDWLSIHTDETDRFMVGMAYLARCCSLLSYMSCEIGLEKRAVYYQRLFEKIRGKYIERYINNGKTRCDSQTSYLLTLAFGLYEEGTQKQLAQSLQAAVLRENVRLTTGFIGVSLLLPVLCDYGYTKEAYTLLLNDEYPSWGYSIRNGATTIWERWNSYTREKGFGDVSMNSFNHYSLGSVGEWMIGYMAGIRVTRDNAGLENVLIQPVVDPLRRVRRVKALYRSIRGNVISSYEMDEGGIRFRIVIPEGLKGELKFKGEYFSLKPGINAVETVL